MIESIKTFSIAASVYACFFWALAHLFRIKKRDFSNIYVIILLAIATFVYIMSYAKFNGMFWFYGNLFPFQALFTLSLFPLFYLYIHSLTKYSPIFKNQYLWHLLFPVIFSFSIMAVTHLWMDSNERYLFYGKHIFSEYVDGKKFTIGLTIYELGKKFYIISSMLYTWMIFRDYKRHLNFSKEIFSDVETTNLGWLKVLFYLFLVLVGFHLLIQLFNNAFVARQELLVILSYFVFASFFFALGYFSFNQKQIYPAFTKMFEREEELLSRINTEEISEFFKSKKPYLNPEYSLFDLCAHFNTNRTYLSNQINQGFKMNFRTLINSHRLNEAKSIIKSEILKNNNISLEYIALKSGFNSYSTFSRVFKFHEDITPLEYKENLLKHGW